MKQLSRHLLTNNAPLKILSFIVAFAFWSSLSMYREREETVLVDLCFSDVETIAASTDTIAVTLRGTRAALNALDREAIAAHIDTNRLPQGTHEKIISGADLLLPQNIKLVHYQPSNIVITKDLSAPFNAS